MSWRLMLYKLGRADLSSCADALLDPFYAVLVRLVDEGKGLNVYRQDCKCFAAEGII